MKARRLIAVAAVVALAVSLVVAAGADVPDTTTDTTEATTTAPETILPTTDSSTTTAEETVAATTAALTTTTTTAAVATSTTTTTSRAPAPPTSRAGTTSGESAASAPADRSDTPVATAAALVPVSAPTSSCVLVGAVGLSLPGRPPELLGPAVEAPPVNSVSLGSSAFPADGSVLTAEGGLLQASCGSAGRRGSAQLQSLSLFGGVATASSVRLSVTGGDPRAGVEGLRVHGRPIPLTLGGRFWLGSWGYLLAPGHETEGRQLNASTLKASGDQGSALSVHLVAPHAGLPAGTVLSIGFVGIQPPPAAPAQPRKTRPRAAGVARPPAPEAPKLKLPTVVRGSGRPPHLVLGPLAVTPPLTGGPYLFPVVGTVEFGDSYGGLRTDVSGGWHHGDDIFAPLGTPVVAVADGTLNRVGWERIGGWRLWVRDREGDEFYYAHLSGYTPAALAGGKIKAGEVLGFVGNTGDAFTTMPHLHFEIHPRPLLHLKYDGAVDPTTYLEGWRHEAQVFAPLPVHPRLPLRADARAEAEQDFRKLLAARGVARRSRPGIEVPRPLPTARLPLPLVHEAAPPAPAPNPSGVPWALLAAVVGAATAVAGAAALCLRAYRRKAAGDGA